MADTTDSSTQYELISTDIPYRGGIHNVEVVWTGQLLEDVDSRLYALVQEDALQYDIPLDDPVYAQMLLFTPGEDDCQESEEGNDW